MVESGVCSEQARKLRELGRAGLVSLKKLLGGVSRVVWELPSESMPLVI